MFLFFLVLCLYSMFTYKGCSYVLLIKDGNCSVKFNHRILIATNSIAINWVFYSELYVKLFPTQMRRLATTLDTNDRNRAIRNMRITSNYFTHAFRQSLMVIMYDARHLSLTCSCQQQQRIAQITFLYFRFYLCQI